jgi:hypothetical protein
MGNFEGQIEFELKDRYNGILLGKICFMKNGKS